MQTKSTSAILDVHWCNSNSKSQRRIHECSKQSGATAIRAHQRRKELLANAQDAKTGVPVSYQLPTTGPLPQTYRVTLAIVDETQHGKTVSRVRRSREKGLCLPDDAAKEAVAMIENPGVRVIDASTAYRVDPAWTYGFAEMAHAPGRLSQAEKIAGATRVSNPGCYPTGFIGLVRPLVKAGLIPADWPMTPSRAGSAPY